MIAPRWEATPCDEAATEALAAALRIAPPVARLLCQRGFSEPELAARFLNPTPDHHHGPSRAGRGAAARVRDHQPEAPRLCLPGQVPGGRRRGAESRAGSLPPSRTRKLAAWLREGGGDWYARRRGAARRGEPRNRQ